VRKSAIQSAIKALETGKPASGKQAQIMRETIEREMGKPIDQLDMTTKEVAEALKRKLTPMPEKIPAPPSAKPRAKLVKVDQPPSTPAPAPREGMTPVQAIGEEMAAKLRRGGMSEEGIQAAKERIGIRPPAPSKPVKQRKPAKGESVKFETKEGKRGIVDKKGKFRVETAAPTGEFVKGDKVRYEDSLGHRQKGEVMEVYTDNKGRRMVRLYDNGERNIAIEKVKK